MNKVLLDNAVTGAVNIESDSTVFFNPSQARLRIVDKKRLGKEKNLFEFYLGRTNYQMRPSVC